MQKRQKMVWLKRGGVIRICCALFAPFFVPHTKKISGADSHLRAFLHTSAHFMHPLYSHTIRASMSLNPGKIRIFLIFKSQNFLIEKKKFRAARENFSRTTGEDIFFVVVVPQCGVVTFFSPPQCLIQESDFKIFGVSLCFPQDVFQF